MVVRRESTAGMRSRSVAAGSAAGYVSAVGRDPVSYDLVGLSAVLVEDGDGNESPASSASN